MNLEALCLQGSLTQLEISQKVQDLSSFYVSISRCSKELNYITEKLQSIRGSLREANKLLTFASLERC